MNLLRGDLVRVATEDGIFLHGFLSRPEKETKRAILHLHGQGGNFFENDFLRIIAGATHRTGWAFLSVNHRGFGRDTEFWKSDFSGYRLIGSEREKLEDCIYDIHAWINFLVSRGYKDVILEGHSHSAAKSVYYQYKKNNPVIVGMIFLSPTDPWDFLDSKMSDKEFKDRKTLAESMIRGGRGGELMPDDGSYIQPTAVGFKSWSSEDSRIFSFVKDMRRDFLKKISVPCLAILGEKDWFLNVPASRISDVLKQNVPEVVVEILENTGHHYLGQYEKLDTAIYNWLKENY